MTPDLSIASQQTVGKRIAANTGLMVGSKALGVLFGVGTLWVAIKSLTPVEFGTVIFLHAYMLFFAEVATFTTWQSIIRFGTDDLEKNHSNGLARLIKFGIVLDILSVVFAYIASLALFGFVVWITQKFPNLTVNASLDVGTLRNYSALYCLVVFARQIGTSIGIFRLFDRFKVLAVEALIMPVLRLIGSIYAAMSGWGLEGFLVVWFVASLMSYLFMMSMGALELRKRRLLMHVVKARLNFMSPRKGLWPFVIKSNIDSTLATGNMHLPLLLVMAVFGAAWAGVYKIAEEVARLLSEGFKLFDQVIYPEVQKLVGQGDSSKIWRIVMRAAFILLSVGVAMSVFVHFIGPHVLGYVFGEDYITAAPLASLLVPAAALLGIVAPLYPIFYAVDKPEKAIYARGAAVLSYIVAFLILSFTIGRMAPGWAAIIGNSVAVLWVLLTVGKALAFKNATDNESANTSSMKSPPKLVIVGQSDLKLWGLHFDEWQRRAFMKAGAYTKNEAADASLFIAIDWVFSPALAAAIVQTSEVALITQSASGENRVVAIHSMQNDLSDYIGKIVDREQLKSLGLRIAQPDDIAGNYNKTLRKTEPPYVLNVHEEGIYAIEKRQFAGSYKGITDFVTKFFWPLPAFHVTRFCSRLGITPNFVTTLSLILVFVATYYFWQGQWVIGLMAGWTMTFLDTVDGKLARTTMTYSFWGNLYDHGIDLIHPPFWYIAWFLGLSASGHAAEFTGVYTGDILQLALIAILLGYIVDRLIEAAFLGAYGFHIHVWNRINSTIRFITARRNPNMFIFMIALIISIGWPPAASWGFVGVAVWTWACILFNFMTLMASFLAKGPLVSWMETS